MSHISKLEMNILKIRLHKNRFAQYRVISNSVSEALRVH